MDHEGSPRFGRIIAKAWADDGFKARLQASPAETLAAEGIAVPEGVSLAILEDSPSILHFVLPQKPDEGEIDEMELDGVAGGFCCCCPSVIDCCR